MPNKGIIRYLFYFLASVMMLCSFAWAVEVYEILDVSKSKHTVVVNRGAIDGIKSGEKAKFILQKGEFTEPKLSDLATGTCVKVLDNWSYWLLEVINNPKDIFKGQKVVVLSEKESVQGRRDLNLLKRKVLSSKEISNEDIQFEEKVGMPKELVSETEDYSHGRQLVETELSKHQDVESTQYKTWKAQGKKSYLDEEEKELSSLYEDESIPAVSSKGLQDKYRNEIHEAQTIGLVEKTNALKFGLKGLHHQSIALEGRGSKSSKITIKNVYDKYKEQKKRKRILGESVDLKYQSEGEMWSADFTDKQLRNYIVQSGIEREERAQQQAILEKSGNELTFTFDNAYTNATSSEDPNNQANSYSITIGYEYHLSRSFDHLQKWTVELFYQAGVGNYDLGNEINGRFAEINFGGAMNYYLWNKPSTLNNVLLYVGGGYKKGSANVSNINLSKDYTYQIVALPFVHAGVKYRFRSGDALDDDVPIGLGFYGRITAESLTLTPLSEIESSDNIQGSQTVANGKFSLGMSFYF